MAKQLPKQILLNAFDILTMGYGHIHEINHIVLMN